MKDLGEPIEQIGISHETNAPALDRLRRADLARHKIFHARTRLTNPLRIAEAVGIAAALRPDHIRSVLAEIIPPVLDHLQQKNDRIGMMVVHYEPPAEDGSVVVHGGFDIGDQTVSGDNAIQVKDLPTVEVASVVHRGSMENVGPVYEALLRWIDDQGYRIAGFSRELHFEHDVEDYEKSATELQIPISR